MAVASVGSRVNATQGCSRTASLSLSASLIRRGPAGLRQAKSVPLLRIFLLVFFNDFHHSAQPVAHLLLVTHRDAVRATVTRFSSLLGAMSAPSNPGTGTGVAKVSLSRPWACPIHPLLWARRIPHLISLKAYCWLPTSLSHLQSWGGHGSLWQWLFPRSHQMPLNLGGDSPPGSAGPVPAVRDRPLCARCCGCSLGTGASPLTH